MITLRGVIRPNAPYVQHAHGDVVITGPREFAVDDAADKVVDEKGKPLVLTPTFYEGLRKKFGAQLVCEPVGGDGEGAASKITALEARVAELEAQLAAAHKAAKSEKPAKA